MRGPADRVDGKQDGSRTSNDSSPASDVNQQINGDADGEGDGQQADDGRRPVKADPPAGQPVHQGQIEEIAGQEGDAGNLQAGEADQVGDGILRNRHWAVRFHLCRVCAWVVREIGHEDGPEYSSGMVIVYGSGFSRAGSRGRRRHLRVS